MRSVDKCKEAKIHQHIFAFRDPLDGFDLKGGERRRARRPWYAEHAATSRRGPHSLRAEERRLNGYQVDADPRKPDSAQVVRSREQSIDR